MSVGEVALTLVLMDTQLHYPNDLDGPLNETSSDNIRQYRVDYNNRPSNAISFVSNIAITPKWDLTGGTHTH